MSYNSLIHACGVKGNILAAEGWLEDMLKHDLPVSVTTFASLIDACAKAGNLEKAEKWMEDLEWADVEGPTKVVVPNGQPGCLRMIGCALAGLCCSVISEPQG